MNKKILTCFLFFYLRRGFSTINNNTTFDDDGLNFETIANKTFHDDEVGNRNETDTETEDFDVAIVETEQ